MAIIKWDPFKEIEKLFSEEFFPALVPTFTVSSVPVDIYETDKELVVEVGLPGLKPEDVKVVVEDDRLIIEGKKEEKKEVKEENYYRKEIRRGAFRKVVYLPYVVNEDKAKAKMENGILKIVFPKEEKEEKGKEIKIE